MFPVVLGNRVNLFGLLIVVFTKTNSTTISFGLHLCLPVDIPSWPGSTVEDLWPDREPGHNIGRSRKQKWSSTKMCF